MKFLKVSLVAASIVFSSSVNATSILVSQGLTVNYGSYGYGNADWSNMTSFMDSATGNNVDIAQDFSNLTQLLSYDALWLDTRDQSEALSQVEIDNIRYFISTGRRVVLNGENYFWNTWNQSILDTVDGSTTNGMDYYTGVSSTVLQHELTSGVNSIYIAAGGVSFGGTELFDTSTVAIWGSGNVVTMLDFNICENRFIGQNDNAQFCSNLATWAATSVSPVPVPAAFWLLGSGLIGLVGFARFTKA